MKIDIENPSAVIEAFLTSIRRGELAEVVPCRKCKNACPIGADNLYKCSKLDVVVDACFFCRYGLEERKNDGKDS